MKKLKISICIVISMIILIGNAAGVPFAVSAYGVESEDYRYVVLDDGTASVLGYSGKDERIVIPSEIDGYTVTEIGDRMMSSSVSGFDTVKSVVIPDSVITINKDAFSYSSKLQNVVIGDNVITIGKGAFSWCNYLVNVSMGRNVETIEENAFYTCESLHYLEIPENVIGIGDKAVGYKYTMHGQTGDLNDGTFKIYGFIGTAAEKYANENGFEFIVGQAPIIYTEPSESISTEPYTDLTEPTEPSYINTNPTEFIEPTDTPRAIESIQPTTPTEETVNIIVAVKPKLNITSKTIKVLDTFNLTVKGKVGTPKFSSNNKKVATVNSSGKVRGVSNGTATIKVNTNGLVLKCKVKVNGLKIKKLSKVKNGFTASISVPKGIKNYSIQYSRTKKFKMSKMGYQIYQKRKSKVKITWLESGAKYYVRLCYAKTIGDKVYRSYSNVKTIRIKGISYKKYKGTWKNGSNKIVIKSVSGNSIKVYLFTKYAFGDRFADATAYGTIKNNSAKLYFTDSWMNEGICTLKFKSNSITAKTKITYYEPMANANLYISGTFKKK